MTLLTPKTNINHQYLLKIYKLIVTFFLITFLVDISQAEETKNPFFDNHGVATDALVELLGETGIQIKNG